jgi:hypothetical protein
MRSGRWPEVPLDLRDCFEQECCIVNKFGRQVSYQLPSKFSLHVFKKSVKNTILRAECAKNISD